MKPVAVLIHVPDVPAALAWYRAAFPGFRVSRPASEALAILEGDGFDIEIVRADAKVPAGKGGSVLYWSVSSLEEARGRLVDIGAKPYRGPVPVGDGSSMCQLEDPFGNLLGLRGRP